MTTSSEPSNARELTRLRAHVERLKRALPECQACEGSGYIEHDAVLTGRNMHSACREQCEACEGTGAEL